jgi:uncharacterized protein YggU (UPF0235/DUF167 family)
MVLPVMKTSKRIIKVTAKPRAKKAEVKETAPGHYRIAVAAAPEKGKANSAIIKALACHLGVAPSRLKILKGVAGKKKIVEID